MDKTTQIEMLTQDYLNAFLSFAKKRTGNFSEAEELAQEIAYQCVISISKGKSISNFEAFVWSIAHNTYKRWCIRRQTISIEGEYDTFSSIANDDLPVDSTLMDKESFNLVRRQLSRLSNLYRKTLVHFYYDELSIREISEFLGISEEMVKFYLLTQG